MPDTLPAFTREQFNNAKLYLATTVAEMMGRKFEEGDWAKVYCAAKGVPLAAWSNLDIDIMYGNLGVEHKMLCRPDRHPIKNACGTSQMHPAGTRALRVPPGERDATVAARKVLEQYSSLISNREAIIRIVNRFHHGLSDRREAIVALKGLGMGEAKATRTVPEVRVPVGKPDDPLDMRTGWLLWQQNLREFLYFEERMEKPDPKEFTATWSERAEGRRRGSRNLWVYRGNTKVYSITNEAGVKLQPYFTVPGPNDPHLYHFIAQGEDIGDGLIRVWLTEATARLLRERLGENGLTPDALAEAIAGATANYKGVEVSSEPFGGTAVSLSLPMKTYEMMQRTFKGVSDEHNFKRLLESLS